MRKQKLGPGDAAASSGTRGADVVEQRHPPHTRTEKLPQESNADKVAKLREIDRRYNAKRRAGWKRMSRVSQIVALRRGQLARLLAARHDRRSIEDVGGVDWHLQKPREVSERFGITLLEKMAHGLWHFPACDVTEEEEAAAIKERRNAKAAARMRATREATKRERQTKKMEMENMVSDLSVRGELIYVLLKASGKWTSVKQMARKVAGLPAFRRGDGVVISGKSLEVTIRNALKDMIEGGQIERKDRPTARGFKLQVRWRADGKTEKRKSKPVRTCKTPQEIVTTSSLRTTSANAFANDSYYPSANANREIKNKAIRTTTLSCSAFAPSDERRPG
jgi:hypothetical protein